MLPRIVKAIASATRLRCPVCRQGKVFRSLWRMHDECPACGLRFQRAPGFFFGAMYFSYGLGVLAALPTAIVLVVRGWDPTAIALVIAAELTVLSPFLIRYSRIAWIYLDQWLDPRQSTRELPEQAAKCLARPRETRS